MTENPAFAAAMEKLLRHEGGYVDDPDDPGGATNLGVTRKVLARHRGVTPWQRLPKSEVKNLTVREATEIYKLKYWDSVRADDLPPGLSYAMFDFAVNSGPKRAIITMQRSLRVVDDGIIGGMTMRAINGHNNKIQLIRDLCERRLSFMRKLRHWWKYKNGWTRRVHEVEAESVRIQQRYERQS